MCMSKSKVDFITIIIQDVASALGKTRKSPWFWEIRNTKEEDDGHIIKVCGSLTEV